MPAQQQAGGVCRHEAGTALVMLRIEPLWVSTLRARSLTRCALRLL
jgi:hypothetical protein